MAVIRLIPSSYERSNTNYVTVSNPDNMYNNTDHTSNYCTLRGRAGRSSNSTYYAFINGFNFDDVPSNATVTGFRVLIRAYRGSYMASGNTNYRMSLASQASNSYKIGNTTLSEDITTSSTSGGVVYEFPIPSSLTWDTLKNYGSDFSIDIPLRNSSTSSNNYPYVYVSGAEIEVTYTVPNPRTVTTTLSGNGEIDPSGTQTMYDGDEYNLIVTPTNSSDTVTATKNGTSITLTQHQGGSTTESNVLGAYTLVSGGFNGSGASYFQGIVGHGHDTSSTTTSNYYSSGNGTIAVFTYNVPFTDIPDNATITSLYMLVNGHAESTSQGSEYMCAQLISGSTALSDELNFKSVGTSNSTQTVTANVTPTIAQLENLKVQCRLGYYGGAINGATVYLTYEVAGVYYTYSTTINGDMTIAVTIGGGGGGPKLYFKQNSSETLIASETNTFDDDTLRYQTPANLLNIGDVIKIIFIDVSATYQRVPVKHIDYDEFTTTLTSDTYQDLGTNDIKCRIYHIYSASIQSRYYTFYPYYLYNGSSCSSMGTMNIYKITSTGSWTLVAQAYKKINGSWVQQSDLTTVFNSNTNYVKG